MKGHTRYPVVIVFVGALEGRHRYCHLLRHCYTEPMKGALGLLIELSDIIVEHRTKHAEVLPLSITSASELSRKNL